MPSNRSWSFGSNRNSPPGVTMASPFRTAARRIAPPEARSSRSRRVRPIARQSGPTDTNSIASPPEGLLQPLGGHVGRAELRGSRPRGCGGSRRSPTRPRGEESPAGAAFGRRSRATSRTPPRRPRRPRAPTDPGSRRDSASGRAERWSARGSGTARACWRVARGSDSSTIAARARSMPACLRTDALVVSPYSIGTPLARPARTRSGFRSRTRNGTFARASTRERVSPMWPNPKTRIWSLPGRLASGRSGRGQRAGTPDRKAGDPVAHGVAEEEQKRSRGHRDDRRRQHDLIDVRRDEIRGASLRQQHEGELPDLRERNADDRGDPRPVTRARAAGPRRRPPFRRGPARARPRRSPAAPSGCARRTACRRRRRRER